MRKAVSALLFLGVLALGACAATSTDTAFPIASGALRSNELPLESYAPVSFSARVFDVVNQDMTSETNTGLAGKVEPTPIDVLSAYAARKFKATGGVFATRFVIQQAQFNVRSVPRGADPWPLTWMDMAQNEAELSLMVNVMLSASRDGGNATNISATTTQSMRMAFGSTLEERREAYMSLMKRALDAIDAEFATQIPVHFSDVILR